MDSLSLRLQTACPPSPTEPFLRLMNGLIQWYVSVIAFSLIQTVITYQCYQREHFLGHSAPAALHSLMALTRGGGKLPGPVSYWARVAGPSREQLRCPAARGCAQVSCLPVCPWRTGLGVHIPLGVESGLRDGGREQSTTLNRVGQQKALEVPSIWTVVRLFVFPLGQL